MISLETSTTVQFYHHDALGSTVNLTDKTGAVIVAYWLDPWGHIRKQEGESVNRQVFTGQEHDEKTGLIYFGSRYFDPDTARFITQDSYLGEQGTPPSLDRYLYAYANPTVYIDLLGYDPMWYQTEKWKEENEAKQPQLSRSWKDASDQQEEYMQQQKEKEAFERQQSEAYRSSLRANTNSETRLTVEDPAGVKEIDDKPLSFEIKKDIIKGFSTGTRKEEDINAVVIHQTAGSSLKSALAIPQSGSSVGANYYIDKDGTILQLAEDTTKVSHVGDIRPKKFDKGESSKEEKEEYDKIWKEKINWGKRAEKISDIDKKKAYPERFPANVDSIGIEFVGDIDKSTGSFETATPQQQAAADFLLKYLSKKYKLKKDDFYYHGLISYKHESMSEGTSVKINIE